MSTRAVGADRAAMAVVGVLAQAGVGDQDERQVSRRSALNASWTMPSSAHAPLPSASFHDGQPEQQHAADAESGEPLGLADDLVG